MRFPSLERLPAPGARQRRTPEHPRAEPGRRPRRRGSSPVRTLQDRRGIESGHHRETRCAIRAPRTMLVGDVGVDPHLRVDHVHRFQRDPSAHGLALGAGPGNPGAPEETGVWHIGSRSDAQLVVDHSLDRHAEEEALPGPARREPLFVQSKLHAIPPRAWVTTCRTSQCAESSCTSRSMVPAYRTGSPPLTRSWPGWLGSGRLTAKSVATRITENSSTRGAHSK